MVSRFSPLPKSPSSLPAPLITVQPPLPYLGVKIVVLVTSAGRGDINFLHHVSDSIESRWHLSTEPYLFIVAAAPPVRPDTPTTSPLVLCASRDFLLARASLLTGAKLIGRVAGARHGNRWLASVRDAGAAFDDEALWDVVRKAARAPVDFKSPPPGSMGIEEKVAAARAKLERVPKMENVIDSWLDG